MFCGMSACLRESGSDPQQTQQLRGTDPIVFGCAAEVIDVDKASNHGEGIAYDKPTDQVDVMSLDKGFDLVTWADLEKVRDELLEQVRNELFAKFLELQRQGLQSGALPEKPSIEAEDVKGSSEPLKDLGNTEEEDEEKTSAEPADEYTALRLQLKARMKDHDCYEFEESTWDTTMFAFIHPLRFMDSFFTIVVGTLNILLQIMFCALIQAQFTQSDDYEKAGRDWRQMNGHWQKYSNDVGTSLAARVCRQDLSLELSGVQLSMYQLASGYITDSMPFLKDIIGDLSIKVGPLLCFLCLMLWYLSSIWNEVYRCYCLFKALHHLQWGFHTSLQIAEEGFAIKQISYGRLALIILLTLIRLGIACLLFHSGSVWLAATAEIRDMVLNAAALAFVLEIDNMICQFMTPPMVLCILKHMSPVEIKEKRLSIIGTRVSDVTPKESHKAIREVKKLCQHVPWHALLCLVSMLTVTIFNFNNHVMPQFKQMEMAAEAFCGEPTNFVVDTHRPTGIVFSWRQEQQKGVVPADSLMTQIVEEVIQHGSSENVKGATSWLDFRTSVALPLEDFIETYGVCHDFRPEQQYLKAPLQRAVKHLVTSCTELTEEDCMVSEPIVRFACPVTCGCASPYSGFFALAGCPITNCQKLNQDAWQIWRSKDIEPSVLDFLPNWKSYWFSYVRFMNSTGRAENAFADMSAQNISDRFTELGCNAIENISKQINDAPTTLNYFCTASSQRRSLQPFCPQQCVCSSSIQRRFLQPFCPTTEASSVCGDLFVSQASIVDCRGYLPHGYNAIGAYTCIAKGYNRKNVYRRYDSVGVLWEIRWESKEHFDWGGFLVGSKKGLNGTAKWTLRSVYNSPTLQEAVHYFSVGGIQPYPTNNWLPRTVNNTDITCATGAAVTNVYLGYHVLEKGNLSCPQSTSSIDAEPACRSAAQGWGARSRLYLGVEYSYNDPPGCIIDVEDTESVRFNEFPSTDYDKQDGSWRPVCEDTEVVSLVGSDMKRWLCTWDNEYVSRFTSSEWYVELGDSISQRGDWFYMGERRIGLHLDGNLKYILKFPNGGMISSGTDAQGEDVSTGDEFTVRFHEKAWLTFFEVEPGQLGDCTFDLIHDCLLSPNYPNKYLSFQRCSVQYRGDHNIHALDFHTEQDFDILSIDIEYSGEAGPVNLWPFLSYNGQLYPDFINFKSDANIAESGFQICEIEGCLYFRSADDCPEAMCTWDGFFCREFYRCWYFYSADDCPAAMCTWDGFECRDVGHNTNSSDVCTDRDGGKDKDGHDCKFYSAKPHMCQHGVFYLDDDDFIAREMCCACGGGSYPAHNVTHGL